MPSTSTICAGIENGRVSRYREGIRDLTVYDIAIAMREARERLTGAKAVCQGHTYFKKV